MWFKKTNKKSLIEEVKEKRCTECGAILLSGNCALGFRTKPRTIKTIQKGYTFEKTIYLPDEECLGTMSVNQAWEYRKLGRVVRKKK